MKKPIFSGHESFRCKTHWLKRGYDFLVRGNNFSNEDAVISLGVGKNMVSSIKYWMKAFGLLDAKNNTIREITHYLLDSENGKDPYIEDLGTLWLLHFLLVFEDHSTLYKKIFVEYHRQRNDISKSKLRNFIKASCYNENYNIKYYNESTLKKDIDVFIQNYCGVGKESVEEQNILLLPLHLIRQGVEKDTWVFNYINHNSIPAEIFLYSIISSMEQNSLSVPYELLQELALIFCLNNNELIKMIFDVCSLYPDEIIFSDNAGIKELQFRKTISVKEVLNRYYQQRI